MHRWDRQLNADSSYVHSNTTLLTGENSIFVILQVKKRETVFFLHQKKSLGPVTQWKHADPQTAPGIITCFSTLHQLIMVGEEKNAA